MADGTTLMPPGAPVGQDQRSAPAASDDALARVRADLEDLGLNGNQARVLVALLRAGAAPPPLLAQLAGVHRTTAYPTLEELRARGLAHQIGGRTAVWTTPGLEEVLERLVAAQEDRVRALRGKVDTTRAALASFLPEEPAAMATQYLHVLGNAAQTRATYTRLVAEAEEELLVLNRPPYSAAYLAGGSRAAADRAGRDELNQPVVHAARRGVSIRVLYQSAQWDDPDATSFREAMAVYHRAGVEGRVAEALPMKLVVADRRVALLALADPVLPEVGFPVNHLVEHPGYASFLAAAFERLWAAARIAR